MMILAVRRLARRVWKYCRRNRWTWYVVGALVILGLGYYLAASKIPAISSKISQVFKSWTTNEKIVVANANVVITATGGVTKITFDANGIPDSVTNEGGTLHVQAIVDTERKEKEKIEIAATTTSEYQESGRDRGRWGARVGVTCGRSPLRLEAGVSRRILGPFGIEVNLSAPKDVQSFDEVRAGLAVTGRW